jgi:hypothetical protein
MYVRVYKFSITHDALLQVIREVIEKQTEILTSLREKEVKDSAPVNTPSPASQSRPLRR